jgi:hypothetical protein
MVTNYCGPFCKGIVKQEANPTNFGSWAGTGVATAKIFQELLRTGSIQNLLYAVYTFTDISAGFFEQAKERFSAASNMIYQVLDISNFPQDHGFDNHPYDLIVTASCVHATPKMKETLRNPYFLLKSDLYLLFSEISSNSKLPGYIFGALSGWWIGECVIARTRLLYHSKAERRNSGAQFFRGDFISYRDRAAMELLCCHSCPTKKDGRKIRSVSGPCCVTSHSRVLVNTLSIISECSILRYQ